MYQVKTSLPQVLSLTKVFTMRIALYKNVLSINPKERKGKTKLEVPIHRSNHSFAKNETSLNKNEGRKSFMKTAATFLLMNSLTAEKLTIF